MSASSIKYLRQKREADVFAVFERAISEVGNINATHVTVIAMKDSGVPLQFSGRRLSLLREVEIEALLEFPSDADFAVWNSTVDKDSFHEDIAESAGGELTRIFGVEIDIGTSSGTSQVPPLSQKPVVTSAASSAPISDKHYATVLALCSVAFIACLCGAHVVRTHGRAAWSEVSPGTVRIDPWVKNPKVHKAWDLLDVATFITFGHAVVDVAKKEYKLPILIMVYCVGLIGVAIPALSSVRNWKFEHYIYCEFAYDLLQGLLAGIFNTFAEDITQSAQRIPGWANLLNGASCLVDMFLFKGPAFLLEGAPKVAANKPRYASDNFVVTSRKVAEPTESDVESVEKPAEATTEPDTADKLLVPHDSIGAISPKSSAPAAAATAGLPPDLEKRSVRELQNLMKERGVDMSGCIEKGDLVKRLRGEA
jgi:hypothetical protein